MIIANGSPVSAPPGAFLSVSDVERLAKAGVKVEWGDIRYQVVPDPEPAAPETLTSAFWHRWDRSHPPRWDSFPTRPYDIYASEYGDKVYVYVQPRDSEPFVLEDDKHLYPSDALMAKLHLREKTK